MNRTNAASGGAWTGRAPVAGSIPHPAEKGKNFFRFSLWEKYFLYKKGGTSVPPFLIQCMGQPWGLSPRRSARHRIISPAMLTAISAGVTAWIAVPMGVWICAMDSSGMPASRSLRFTEAVLVREPMTPT